MHGQENIKSTYLYKYLKIISHKKLSVHGHESFKMYSKSEGNLLWNELHIYEIMSLFRNHES